MINYMQTMAGHAFPRPSLQRFVEQGSSVRLEPVREATSREGVVWRWVAPGRSASCRLRSFHAARSSAILGIRSWAPRNQAAVRPRHARM